MHHLKVQVSDGSLTFDQILTINLTDGVDTSEARPARTSSSGRPARTYSMAARGRTP